MDKVRLTRILREKLLDEQQAVRASAMAAHEGATHEDSKPENQYDTRALEQSYLAGAQAARAEALAGAVAFLDHFIAPTFGPADPIRLGAYVLVDDGRDAKAYWIMEAGGGTRLENDGEQVWVVSPASPLGRALMGRTVGDTVEHVARGEVLELSIERVE
jgi:hypothetical protein